MIHMIQTPVHSSFEDSL